MAPRLPADVLRRAHGLATGDWVPPTALPAATVVLLRDRDGAPEVLLMRRPDSMAFAPGMHVFPGGRVDLQSDLSVPLTGPLPSGDWAPDPESARALAAAAVRETFEEAGILLAVDPTGGHPRPDAQWDADREDAQMPGGFGRVLVRRGLVVDTSRLVPFAHWVTPEVESRRFDTRFLAARVPEGQRVAAHPRETDGCRWIGPATALAAHGQGLLPLLPPTVAVLAELARHPDALAALAWAAQQVPTPLMPRPVAHDGRIDWSIVHAYTGAVVRRSGEPLGSEVHGTSS